MKANALRCEAVPGFLRALYLNDQALNRGSAMTELNVSNRVRRLKSYTNKAKRSWVEAAATGGAVT